MPNGLNNWTYKDLTSFLKENNFEFLEFRKGSHEAWLNRTTNAIVEINVHGSKSFLPRTLETMIRQSRSEKFLCLFGNLFQKSTKGILPL